MEQLRARAGGVSTEGRVVTSPLGAHGLRDGARLPGETVTQRINRYVRDHDVRTLAAMLVEIEDHTALRDARGPGPAAIIRSLLEYDGEPPPPVGALVVDPEGLIEAELAKEGELPP